MMADYDYPPENKELYPPGSFGYVACELTEELETLKAELVRALPKLLYRIVFMFASKGE